MGENIDSKTSESSDAKDSARESSNEESKDSLEARVEGTASSKQEESPESSRAESRGYASQARLNYSEKTKSNSGKKSGLKFKKYVAAAGIALSLYSGANSNHEENSKNIQEAVYHSDSHDSAKKSSGKKVQGYATAIIYHTDKETGRRFIVLEENPSDYGFVIERNHLRPVGGTQENYDKNRYETLKREFKEEIGGNGSSILIKNLEETGKFLMTIRTEHPSEISETDLYEIEIKDEKEWKEFLRARWGHDAGYQRIFSDAEIKTIPDDKFAYVYSRILKSWVGGSGHANAHGSSHHSSYNAIAGNYATKSDIVPFKSATLESKVKNASAPLYKPVSSHSTLVYKAA